MKHPVLTRAFAIVLVIMAIILIGASSYGLIKARNEYSDSLEDISLLQSRLDEFEILTEKLSGKDDYATGSENYDKQLEEYNSDVAQFHTDLALNTATKAGIKETRKTLVDMSGLILSYQETANATIIELEAKSSEAESGKAQAQQALDGLNAYTQYPGIDDSSALPPQMAQMYPDISTVGEAKLMLQGMIAQADAGIDQIASVKSSILSGIGSGWDGINDAVYMLNNKEKELNEDYDSLTAEKSRLESESARLKELESELSELKSDEQRLDALDGLLQSNSGIKSAFESGISLSEAAKAEIAQEKADSYNTYAYKIALNIIGIAAGVFAFIGLSAAFEKTGSRFALIFPPVLFTLLSFVSLCINIYITADVSYAAMMSALFGLIQVIIVISDKQKNTAS